MIRVHLARPVEEGPWPGLIFYLDIYQLGDPILRLANPLAGYGFVVAVPEIFHCVEPVGTVIAPDVIGRLRGNDAALRTEIASYDADAKAMLTWLSEQTRVDEQRHGAIGFCIGGHLAFRAALRPEVRATVCLYPTGLQNGKLGRGVADSLQRAGEIKVAFFTLLAPKTLMCRLRIVNGFSRPCRGDRVV